MTFSTSTHAVIVQQGKVLDFIDGLTQRNETPEEYVRQEIAKSLVREYAYPKTDIAVELVIRVGSRKPRADLVIFATGATHIQDYAYIIVECKAMTVKSTDRKEGIGQLQSYLSSCPNAQYGMWTNGIERYCYRKVVRNGQIHFEEVPDLPSYGQTEADAERPRFDQLKPASSDALLFAFRRCHNYIAGNQGLQKPEAFWELLKLIFCKIHDERESAEVEFYAGAKERTGINGPLKVKARLDLLFSDVKEDYPTIFSANETIGLKPDVLPYLVSQLQMYSLLESDVDVKGHAYEEIVGSNLRGDRGEFFTPRNICNMAVAMLDPGENQLMLDPACGTSKLKPPYECALVARCVAVTYSASLGTPSSGARRQYDSHSVRACRRSPQRISQHLRYLALILRRNRILPTWSRKRHRHERERTRSRRQLQEKLNRLSTLLYLVSL